MARDDTAALHIQEGDLVKISSRRGTVLAKARLAEIVRGHVFLPFHYGYWDRRQASHSRVANELTITVWDPDYHRRDLYEAIENGDYPEYELSVQIVAEKDEHAFPFDLLDATKIIPENIVPVQKIGRLVLDRNPDNFFAHAQ
jgi:catalase